MIDEKLKQTDCYDCVYRIFRFGKKSLMRNGDGRQTSAMSIVQSKSVDDR